MKLKYFYTLSLFSTIVLCAFLSGCTTQYSIALKTIKLPEGINDFSAIDTIEIITNTKLSGNVPPGSENLVNSMLYELFSSKITSKGFLRTTDIIWGNSAGVAKLTSLIDKKRSQHGYARYMTDSKMERASLILNFEGSYQELNQTEVLNCPVVDQNAIVGLRYEPRTYFVDVEKIQYDQQGRQTRYKVREPRTISAGPFHYVSGWQKNKSFQDKNFTHLFFGVSCKLGIVLVDKNGTKIYEKTFVSPSNYVIATNYDQNKVLTVPAPTTISMFHSLLDETAEVFSQAISPQKIETNLYFTDYIKSASYWMLVTPPFGEDAKAYDLYSTREIIQLTEGKLTEMEKCIAKEEKSVDKKEIAEESNRLGIAYASLGDMITAGRFFDNALTYGNEQAKENLKTIEEHIKVQNESKKKGIKIK